MRSELPIVQLVGLGVAVLFHVLMLFIGLVMLISPSLWFRLPPYVALRGSITPKYASKASGKISIRVTGLVLSILMSIAICSLFGVRFGGLLDFWPGYAFKKILGAITGLGAAGLGVWFLANARPRTRKWMDANIGELRRRYPDAPRSDDAMLRAFQVVAVFTSAIGLYVFFYFLLLYPTS